MSLIEILERNNTNPHARALEVWIRGKPQPITGYFVTMGEARRIGFGHPEIYRIKNGEHIIYSKG